MISKNAGPFWSSFRQEWRVLRIYSIAFLLGLMTIICQIVFLRESLESFSGNELTIGVFLGSWLFWTGIGSRFSYHIAPHRLEFLCKAGFPVMLVLFASSLFFLPWLRNCLGSPGQIVGIVPTVFIAFVIQAPACFFSGLLFTVIIRLDYHHRKNETSAGIIYFWECLGSVIGGLLATFFFFPLVGSWGCIILLLIPVVLAVLTPGEPIRILPRGVLVFVMLLVVFLAFRFDIPSHIDRSALKIRWPSMDIIDRVHTPYGAIVIIRHEDQLSFYESGLFIIASEDKLTAEQQTHPILLQHRAPRDILVVGGSFGGIIPEILLHKPARIVCVELDPGLVSLARKHFSEFNALVSGHDARTASTEIEMIYGDGRHYVHHAMNSSFDVIMINLPDPSNALINRFFTLEFYQQTQRLLRKGGIISFGLSGADTYIDNNLARYLADMTETVSRVFPHLIVLPGIRCRIIASQTAGELSHDPNIITERLDARGISTEFINDFFIPYEYSPDRQELFSQAIGSVPRDRRQINRDFSPISYYWSTILWSSKISPREMNIFLKIAHLPLNIWLLLLLSPSLVAIILIVFRGRRAPSLLMISVSCGGFCIMTIEICLILAFQVLYGYTYGWMGFLLSMVMAGMAAGSLWTSRSTIHNSIGARRRFGKCLFACMMTPLLLMVFLSLTEELRNVSAAFSFIPVIFPIIALLIGGVGGCVFPAAVMTWRSSTRGFNAAVSWFYWSDLAGAAAGAVIAGSLCIPLLGLYMTLGAASLLMVQAFILHRLFQS